MTIDNRTDRELWDTARGGDGGAFGLLFDRHARAVYNHCFRLVGSWGAAEDLTQAVFLLAWRKRARVRLTNDSALPWLLGVATNVVHSHHRSVTRWLRTTQRLPIEDIPDHAEDVARRIDDERRMTELLAAVRELPRNQREALSLCVWSGVSYADAAAVLGIAEVSVRARVSKARARLRDQLTAPVVALTTPEEAL
ncbi:RNA polymerase subunit sigma-70 [Actinophytocola xinjiangensis]|uniref:RNA polymerase sigma factor n=1 Tax=Actinophytocola xinjiangensis TaxID=485602 RepID=A0A7Z0WNY9_9PSEU|nr:sigma-70 family RNA polymerase sigma factor [Actinophytocola xinjiangensis]OLF11144.1 RNA polymerase subunit sigma-70 [Actinophytocola xinjiangensis]